MTAINGADGRVEEVEVTDLDSGRPGTLACDLVVFTADWIPDHELAVIAGIELDSGTLGPRVDGSMRTPLAGVFAVGNLVHPAETADSCALGGRHAAAAVAEFLGGAADWPFEHVRVLAGEGLRWVVPGLLAPGDPAVVRDRFLLRSKAFLRAPRLEVVQGERRLWHGRLARLVPGRSAHIPSGWASEVDPTGGPVTVRVRGS